MTRQGGSRGHEAISFSQEALREHRRLRTSLWSHIRTANILVTLSFPVIYACLIPFLLLDLAVTIYQAICFPLYGVPKVPRKDYLIFDRGRLGYLNMVEKAGCVYCSYANGLLAYVTEIAGRTEQRFCPIKHAQAIVKPHSRYSHFLPYGDARAYRSLPQDAATVYVNIETRKQPR